MKWRTKVFWKWVFFECLNPLKPAKRMWGNPSDLIYKLGVIIIFSIILFTELSLNSKILMLPLFLLWWLLFWFINQYKGGRYIYWYRKKKGLPPKAELKRLEKNRK